VGRRQADMCCRVRLGSRGENLRRDAPRPCSKDRGGLGHLLGMPVPDVPLPFDEGEPAMESLAAIASRHAGLVVFFYDVDTQRAQAWLDHLEEVEALGWMIVSISARSLAELADFAMCLSTDTWWYYCMFSDSDLKVADALGLPTLEVAGTRVYRPVTLLVKDGCIARVLPPGDPAEEIACVISWIRQQAHA
jgi:peroxiredoxin